MFILSSRSDFPYHAIIVFGLQIDGSDHIYPDQTLLRSTIWQLPELTGWWGNAWVIGQRVHLKGTLHVQKPHKTIVSTTLHSFLSLIKSAQTTLSSPTTVGSSFPSSFLPRNSLKVSQKSVRPLNSETSSSSRSYTWKWGLCRISLHNTLHSSKMKLIILFTLSVSYPFWR